MALDIKISGAVSMVGYQDDPGVVIYAHLAEIVEPLTKLEERGHVHVIVEFLHSR